MDFLREIVFPGPPRNCPFCPGNEGKTPPEILAYGRNGTGPNSAGWSIRVVPNRFPALGIEGELDREGEGRDEFFEVIGKRLGDLFRDPWLSTDLLVENMKTKGIHPRDLNLLPEGRGWLLVEFGGEDRNDSDNQARRMMDSLKKHGNSPSMK